MTASPISPPEPVTVPLPEPEAAQLIPQALPYLFIVTFPRATLEEIFELAYGAQQRDRAASANKRVKRQASLPRATFEKGVPGGKGALYANQLHQILQSSLARAVYPREVLAIDEMSYNEGAEKCSLSCTVYFREPAKVTSSLPRVTPWDASQVPVLVAAEKLRMQRLKSRDTEKAGPSEEGDVMVITLRSQVDGKDWLPACLTKHRVVLRPGEVRPSELYVSLLGREVGNHFFSIILPDEPTTPPGMVGKKVECTCTVHGIFSEVLAPWAELAPEFGHETEAQLDDKLTRDIARTLQQNWRNRVVMEAIQVLRQGAQHLPLPAQHILRSSQLLYDQHKAKAGGNEKKALDSLGVKSEEEARQRFAFQVQAEASQIAILLGYGVRRGIAREPNEALHPWLERIVDALCDELEEISGDPEEVPALPVVEEVGLEFIETVGP